MRRADGTVHRGVPSSAEAPLEEADKIKQGKVLRGRRQLWPCGGARLPKEGCCWPSVWVLSARVLALSTSSYMRRIGSGDPPCVCFSWLLRSRPWGARRPPLRRAQPGPGWRTVGSECARGPSLRSPQRYLASKVLGHLFLPRFSPVACIPCGQGLPLGAGREADRSKLQ